MPLQAGLYSFIAHRLAGDPVALPHAARPDRLDVVDQDGPANLAGAVPVQRQFIRCMMEGTEAELQFTQLPLNTRLFPTKQLLHPEEAY